eukprot:763457-Hanusia_phi.AAC.2
MRVYLVAMTPTRNLGTSPVIGWGTWQYPRVIVKKSKKNEEHHPSHAHYLQDVTIRVYPLYLPDSLTWAPPEGVGY